MSDDIGPLRPAGEHKVFHDRHGHVLPPEKSLLQTRLDKIWSRRGEIIRCSQGTYGHGLAIRALHLGIADQLSEGAVVHDRPEAQRLVQDPREEVGLGEQVVVCQRALELDVNQICQQQSDVQRSTIKGKASIGWTDGRVQPAVSAAPPGAVRARSSTR